MGIKDQVTWVRCTNDQCGGKVWGVCKAQIFLAVEHPLRWHLGRLTGTATHNACAECLGAK
jgi:hypothetical protein